MAVIGNLSTNGHLVSKHIDKDDFITVLFHVGQPLYGDRTSYYTGLTSDEHGCYQNLFHVNMDVLLLDVLINLYTVVKHGKDHMDV